MVVVTTHLRRAVHGQVYQESVVCQIVGLDIAKNVFQVHGVDAGGALVVAKAQLR
jgi:hypothetical protein